MSMSNVVLRNRASSIRCFSRSEFCFFDDVDQVQELTMLFLGQGLIQKLGVQFGVAL